MANTNIRWEYKTLRIKPGLLGSFDFGVIDETLAREGNQGWELVNAMTLGMALPIVLFLKRAR
jgi:hypothetical protein